MSRLDAIDVGTGPEVTEQAKAWRSRALRSVSSQGAGASPQDLTELASGGMSEIAGIASGGIGATRNPRSPLRELDDHICAMRMVYDQSVELLERSKQRTPRSVKKLGRRLRRLEGWAYVVRHNPERRADYHDPVHRPMGYYGHQTQRTKMADFCRSVERAAEQSAAELRE